MNIDEPSKTKKRKAPASGTSVEQEDPESAAYNENSKDTFKARQEEAGMQYEDDFEDEYEQEEVENTMDTGDQDDEDPQDDIMPEEEEQGVPEVRLPSVNVFSSSCYFLPVLTHFFLGLAPRI